MEISSAFFQMAGMITANKRWALELAHCRGQDEEAQGRPIVEDHVKCITMELTRAVDVAASQESARRKGLPKGFFGQLPSYKVSEFNESLIYLIM